MGCDVASAYNDTGKSKCEFCPFSICLDQLNRKWSYYSRHKKLVSQTWELIDKDTGHKEIAEHLKITPNTVYKFQKDRDVLQPIYTKLQNARLTKLKGPKIL
jgi:hypothetical protein